MKLPTLSTLLLMVAIALAIVDIARAQCYSPNPLNLRQKEEIQCDWVNESTEKVKRQTAQTINKANTTNMFEVTFTCGSNNKVLCGKVQNAFNIAGGIITSVLDLNQPIKVNATFINFCTSMGECGSPEGFITLGGAAPAQTIPMKDTDGKVRQYPQALVKQFNLNNHLAFGPFDIVALFNSIPNYWFQEDGTKLTGQQSDFLFVIVHELVHGLGLASAWDEYIPGVLTPDVSLVTVNGQKVPQFVEAAFDQYMYIIPEKRYASEVTDTLNVYSNGAGAKARSFNAFASGFLASTQGSTAARMFQLATTRNSFGFLPKNGANPKEAIFLETSLVPYAQGSSISHMDYTTFTNTSDFLMRYLQDKGVTMQDAINTGGGGPIGPKLTLILETMGYATKDNPNPYRPNTTANDSTGGGGGGGTISSSHRNLETFQAIWIVAVTTILAILITR